MTRCKDCDSTAYEETGCPLHRKTEDRSSVGAIPFRVHSPERQEKVVNCIKELLAEAEAGQLVGIVALVNYAGNNVGARSVGYWRVGDVLVAIEWFKTGQFL